MSWHRKHRTTHYDKRECALIMQLIEAQRGVINSLNTEELSDSAIKRNYLADLAALENKARAEWVR